MVALPTCDSDRAFRDPSSQPEAWMYDGVDDGCASNDGADAHDHVSDAHFQYHEHNHINPLDLLKSPLSFAPLPPSHHSTNENGDRRETLDPLQYLSEQQDHLQVPREGAAMGTHAVDDMHSNQRAKTSTGRGHSRERTAAMQNDCVDEDRAHHRPNLLLGDQTESEDVFSHLHADGYDDKVTLMATRPALSCSDEPSHHDFDRESQLSSTIEHSDVRPISAGLTTTEERSPRPLSALSTSNGNGTTFCMTENIHRGYETVKTSSKSPNVMDVRVHVISDRFNACNPCRQRKIKCAPNDDINGPTAGMCGTCVKRKKECSWPESMNAKQSHHHGHAALHTGSRFFVGRKTEMTVVPVPSGVDATMLQRHDQYDSATMRDASNGLTRFSQGSDNTKKRKRSSLSRAGKSIMGKDSTLLFSRRDGISNSSTTMLHRRLHDLTSSVSDEDAEGEMEDDYLAPELEPKPLVDIALPEPMFISRHSLGSYSIPALTPASATSVLNKDARACSSTRPELVLPGSFHYQATADDSGFIQKDVGAAVSYTALHSFGRTVSLTSGQSTLSASGLMPSAHPSPVLSSPGYSSCSAVSSQASSVATPLPTPTSDTQFYDDSSYRHPQHHMGDTDSQDNSKTGKGQTAALYGSLAVDTHYPTATIAYPMSSALRSARPLAQTPASQHPSPSPESTVAFSQLHAQNPISATGGPVDYCSFAIMDGGHDTVHDPHRLVHQATHLHPHSFASMDWPVSDFIPASFST